MSVRIKLNDGTTFIVDEDFAKLQERIEAAIEDTTVRLIMVENAKRQRRSINPNAIAFIEETSDEELTRREVEILDSVREN